MDDLGFVFEEQALTRYQLIGGCQSTTLDIHACIEQKNIILSQCCFGIIKIAMISTMLHMLVFRTRPNQYLKLVFNVCTSRLILVGQEIHLQHRHIGQCNNILLGFFWQWGPYQCCFDIEMCEYIQTECEKHSIELIL